MTTRRVRVRDSDEGDDVLDLAHRYARTRHQEREIEGRRKELGANLLPMMQSEGRDKVRVDVNADLNGNVQVKTKKTTTFQEDRLKKAIGAQAYNKLTTPMLDESKIEAAIKLGDLDPQVVASCMETTETPYLEVRFTPRKKGRRGTR